MRPPTKDAPHWHEVVDVDRADPARVYSYWLGGKDNYAADREAGDKIAAALPDVRIYARENRHFLIRAVRRLVRGYGITQFLDIGSGLPADCNVHQVALAHDPAARVVYVDNSPLVAAHMRALNAAEGVTAFILGDAREPETILEDEILADILDLRRPVALMLVSVLMYFPDDVVRDMLDTLVGALPAGSYVTISHPTADFDPATRDAAAAAQEFGLTYLLRSHDEVAAMFSGLGLVEPGVVPMLAWHPEKRLVERDRRGVSYWVGMARKLDGRR